MVWVENPEAPWDWLILACYNATVSYAFLYNIWQVKGNFNSCSSRYAALKKGNTATSRHSDERDSLQTANRSSSSIRAGYVRMVQRQLLLSVGAEGIVTKPPLLYRGKDAYIVVTDLGEFKSTAPIGCVNMELWGHDRAAKATEEFANENDELGVECTHEQMTKQMTDRLQEDKGTGQSRMVQHETDYANSCAATDKLKWKIPKSLKRLDESTPARYIGKEKTEQQRTDKKKNQH